VKITRRQLKQIIKEELGRIAVNTRTRGQHDSSGWTSGLYEDDESSVDIPHAVFDDVHPVPDDLESFDPHDAYGLGHEAGMEHSQEQESGSLDAYSDITQDCYRQGASQSGLSARFAKEAEAKSAALTGTTSFHDSLEKSDTEIDDEILSKIYVSLLDSARDLQGEDR